MPSKTKLINRQQVRKLALSISRQHHFTRAGDSFFVKCEAELKSFVTKYVVGLPSKGKTIQ
jgi:hypothetical protein